MRDDRVQDIRFNSIQVLNTVGREKGKSDYPSIRDWFHYLLHILVNTRLRSSQSLCNEDPKLTFELAADRDMREPRISRLESAAQPSHLCPNLLAGDAGKGSALVD